MTPPFGENLLEIDGGVTQTFWTKNLPKFDRFTLDNSQKTLIFFAPAARFAFGKFDF